MLNSRDIETLSAIALCYSICPSLNVDRLVMRPSNTMPEEGIILTSGHDDHTSIRLFIDVPLSG